MIWSIFMNDSVRNNQHDGAQVTRRLAGNDLGTHPQGPLRVEDIFSGRQVVRLLHEGQEYQLRITRNRKLILTK